MAITLPVALLQDSVGEFEKMINGEPLELLQDMANQIKPFVGDNPVMEQLLAGFKNYQETFNNFTENARGSVESLRRVADLAEYDANKLSVGENKAEAVDFSSGNVGDTSSAMV